MFPDPTEKKKSTRSFRIITDLYMDNIQLYLGLIFKNSMNNSDFNVNIFFWRGGGGVDSITIHSTYYKIKLLFYILLPLLVFYDLEHCYVILLIYRDIQNIF